MATEGPLLLAYDGSASARRAVERAADLFPGRGALVVTVWEPGLALMAEPVGLGVDGFQPMPLAPQEVEAIDEAEQGHARRVAEEGARLARGRGLEARALTVRDEEVKVAEALARVAGERGAAVIVTGSHGHGGLRTRVLGSTSQSLLHDSPVPVLVVPPAATGASAAEG